MSDAELQKNACNFVRGIWYSGINKVEKIMVERNKYGLFPSRTVL